LTTDGDGELPRRIAIVRHRGVDRMLYRIAGYLHSTPIFISQKTRSSQSQELFKNT